MEPPPDGTISRTLHQDERLKAVLFGVAAGQELSEHTSSTPTVMRFLKGETAVTLGDDQTEVGPGDDEGSQAIVADAFPFVPRRLWLYLLLSRPRGGEHSAYILVSFRTRSAR